MTPTAGFMPSGGGGCIFCTNEVSVTIDGAPWARTWWSFAGGETVTEFTPLAKAALSSWDTRFDDDYAAWLTVQAPPAPSCPTC